MIKLTENYQTVTYDFTKMKNKKTIKPFETKIKKEDPIAVAVKEPFMKEVLKEVTKYSILITPLFLSKKALAQESTGFPMLDKAHGIDILPKEFVDIIIQIIMGCGVVGVGFAIICLMAAGGYRMIGQTDKARLWSMDIIKGLGQVLLAPVIILILVTIVSLVFRNIPALENFF